MWSLHVCSKNHSTVNVVPRQWLARFLRCGILSKKMVGKYALNTFLYREHISYFLSGFSAQIGQSHITAMVLSSSQCNTFAITYQWFLCSPEHVHTTKIVFILYSYALWSVFLKQAQLKKEVMALTCQRFWRVYKLHFCSFHSPKRWASLLDSRCLKDTQSTQHGGQ